MKGYRFFVLPVFLFACLALALLVTTLAAQETMPPPVAGEPASLNVEYLGQIGGENATAIAYQGNLAFLGFGSRLVVLDISNQAHPVVLGESEPFTAQMITSLVTVNDRVYVTADKRLWIFTVSDPTQPALLGWYETLGITNRVAVANNYAYVGIGWFEDNGQWQGGLYILDISNSLHPVAVGYYQTPLEVIDVVLDGNNAYLAHGRCVGTSCASGDFRVVNVSDPANPAEVSQYSTGPGSATRVLLNQDRAYVIDDHEECDKFCYSYSTLRVLDISDPTSLSQLGVLPFYSKIWDIELIGGDLYAAAWYIYSLDIADPANMAVIDSYLTSGETYEIVGAGGLALVANGRWGLRLLDVADPANMVGLSSYDTPSAPRDIELADQYAYITAKDGMHIIDVANQSNPQQLGSLLIDEQDQYSPPLAIVGNYAYVPHFHYPGTLHVIDVSDPADPYMLADYINPAMEGYYSIEVADGRAYLLANTSAYSATKWLEILDISVPSVPVHLGVYPFADYLSDIALAGNYAYVANTTGGLRILDVSDPAVPVQVGHYPGEESIYQVEIAGDYAYLVETAGLSRALRVLDVSDPTAPTPAGYYPMSNFPRGLTVQGHHAYLSDGHQLRIIDFSEMTAPTEVGLYSLKGNSFHFQQIAVAGNALYALHEDGGLLNLRFTADSHTVTSNSGATLSYTDTQGTNATVAITPGTVNVTTTLVYAELPQSFIQPGMALAGHAFDIVAYQGGSPLPQLTFLQPITVTIHYTEATIGVISDETALELQWLHENSWLPAATTCAPPSTIYHDPANNLIQVPVCRTGRFALFGPTNQTFLPFIP